MNNDKFGHSVNCTLPQLLHDKTKMSQKRIKDVSMLRDFNNIGILLSQTQIK